MIAIPTRASNSSQDILLLLDFAASCMISGSHHISRIAAGQTTEQLTSRSLSPHASACAVALVTSFQCTHTTLLEIRVIGTLRPGRHVLLAVFHPLRPELAKGLPLLARRQHFACCPACRACLFAEPAHAVVACPCTGLMLDYWPACTPMHVPRGLAPAGRAVA